MRARFPRALLRQVLTRVYTELTGEGAFLRVTASLDIESPRR